MTMMMMTDSTKLMSSLGGAFAHDSTRFETPRDPMQVMNANEFNEWKKKIESCVKNKTKGRFEMYIYTLTQALKCRQLDLLQIALEKTTQPNSAFTSKAWPGQTKQSWFLPHKFLWLFPS